MPAIIRGCIAIAWYGVQTYLASTSLMIIFLKFIPASEALTTTSSSVSRRWVTSATRSCGSPRPRSSGAA